MAEQIELHQALFGYRDGHNLLATSAILAPRVRQFLATITDSSGPESIKGFEGAFTGVPVPETDFYALFRTWSAPEMPRPGCVWTHVILIQLADLARIPDLCQLQHLCLRPTIPIVTTHYEQPRVLQLETVAANTNDKFDERRLHLLVRSLYERPEADIVVLDEESADWETAVFQAWAQQWPRLRREFAFSTGSLGDRRLAGISFDLQIAPVSSERLWRRAGASTLLLNFLTPVLEPFGETTPRWISVTEEDLRDGSPRLFRRFLFDYGSDVGNPRRAFGKLGVIYQKISTSSESSWIDLLSSVADAFPIQKEAVRLKRWLMTVPTSLNPSEQLERVWAIVSFLLDSHRSAAYPRSDFDFESLAGSLWKAKREDTIALLSRLVQREESTAASSFAEGIARSVDLPSLQAISESHDELVPLIIRHNHVLAYESDPWRLKGHVQIQIYETLTRLKLSQEDWGKVVGAMLVAATHVSVRESVALAGEYAMTGAFRWLESPAASHLVPSHAWREALARPSIELLQRSQVLTPAQLALAAWCAPANDVRRTLSASREDVQRLADERSTQIPYPLRTPTAFLLMTIGLKENSDVSAILVLKNFFAVHEALASGAHSSESWWLLSPELPEMGWWRDWDRCEKLRRATHRVLTQHGCSKRLREFATTSDERKIARKVAKSESDDGTEFFD